MNTYCYIMSTFTLPRYSLSPSVFPYSRQFSEKADLSAHPGVGEYNAGNDEVVDINLNTNESLLQVEYKSYYQWVPFVLLLQACLFYTPHALFKLAEGGKVTFPRFEFFCRLPPSSPGCISHPPCYTRGRGGSRRRLLPFSSTAPSTLITVGPSGCSSANFSFLSMWFSTSFSLMLFLGVSFPRMDLRLQLLSDRILSIELTPCPGKTILTTPKHQWLVPIPLYSESSLV